MADVKLQAVLTLKDQMTGKLQGARTKMNQLGKTAALLGAAVVAGIGVKAVQAAVEFETAMTNVSTLIAGDSTKAIDEFSIGIKEMMKTIPVDAEQLGASAYGIMSAGITDVSIALDVLEQSARLGVAGLGSTESATTLMTLALNNFKDSGLSAKEVSDVLFKTVKNGITTVDQMSQSFGLVAPLAVDAGVSIQELSAMTAALTQVNKSASISQNSIKATFIAMSKPTKEALGLFEQLGVKTFPELIKKSGSMVGALGAMKDATNGNSQQFALAIGSGEALTSTVALLGAQSDSYTTSLDNMKNGTNAVDEAFQKQTKSTKAQYELLNNNFNVTLMELGNVLLPVLVDLMPKITQFVDDAMGGWHELTLIFDDVTTAIANVIIWFDNLWATVSKVWGNITGFFSDISTKISNIPVIGNLFGGGKAEGGAVSGGTPYVVGEKGPELFVPQGSGTIIPNDQMGGGAITVNFNNATVRNDSDLDAIISAVKQSLNRDLSVEQLGI